MDKIALSSNSCAGCLLLTVLTGIERRPQCGCAHVVAGFCFASSFVSESTVERRLAYADIPWMNQKY
jgi:hypothetical protein